MKFNLLGSTAIGLSGKYRFNRPMGRFNRDLARLQSGKKQLIRSLGGGSTEVEAVKPEVQSGSSLEKAGSSSFSMLFNCTLHEVFETVTFCGEPYI